MKKLKLILFSIFIASFTLFLNFSVLSYGDEIKNVSTEIYMPGSYLEYYDLYSPIDVAYSENLTAIIENSSLGKNIIIYENGVYKKYTDKDYSFNEINQIKILDGKVILQNGLRPYLFDYNNPVKEERFTEIKDIKNEFIPCTYFDVNKDYLISLNNSTINVYRINAEKKLELTVSKPIPGTDNCIAINDLNDIFYISENKLKITNISNLTSSKEYDFNYSLSASCTSLLANNKFLYFSCANGLGVFDIENETFEMIVETNSINALGELIKAKGIAFKDNNILIADSSLNAIQEFKKENNNYVFSGFAITTTASAFNRLNENSKDIAYSNNKIAVFDTEKLLVIDNNYDNDSLEKYKNFYFSTDLNALGFVPSHIEFNGNIVLFTDNINASFFDITTKEIKKIDDTDLRYKYLNPTSTSYSGGYFYILAKPNGSRNVVIKIDENTLETEEIIIRENILQGDLLTSDIDGYVYIYSGNNIYKYSNKGINRGILESYSFNLTPIKICADLNGNIFALSDQNNIEYYKDNNLYQVKLKLSENLPQDILSKSFTMNFESSEIYFLFNENGLILYSTEIENDNIKNIKIPEDFLITDDSAKSIDKLKIYNANQDENIYQLSKNSDSSQYTFLNVTKANGEEYILGGETDNFYILLNSNIYLIKKQHATLKPFDIDTPSYKGYVSTAVNLYYYPIFKNDFVLTNFTRLTKNTNITIINSIEFQNNKFYYVSIDINDTIKYGYIPIEFIVKTVPEKEEHKEYSYKTIKKNSTIYEDENMSLIYSTFDENVYCKVIQINEAISFIEYNTDTETHYGYIYNSDILIKENSYKNSIIILIVAFSITITSIFFVFKKKN